MTQKRTEISAPNGFAIIECEHLTREEAIEKLRSYADGQMVLAQSTLEDIAAGEVKVERTVVTYRTSFGDF